MEDTTWNPPVSTGKHEGNHKETRVSLSKNKGNHMVTHISHVSLRYETTALRFQRFLSVEVQGKFMFPTKKYMGNYMETPGFQ